MRPRATVAALLIVLALVALPEGGDAALSEQQTFFRTALIEDPRTAAGVRSALQARRAFPDRRSGFVDVTGDGKQDALVLVSTGGAAGTVALYLFSTDGAPPPAGGGEPALRPVLRLQALHRATVRLSGSTVTVVEPRWSEGDDLCCPQARRERDYTWRADRRTFVRSALRDDVE